MEILPALMLALMVIALFVAVVVGAARSERGRPFGE